MEKEIQIKHTAGTYTLGLLTEQREKKENNRKNNPGKNPGKIIMKLKQFLSEKIPKVYIQPRTEPQR